MLRVFTDRRCLSHPAPPGYPERPERLRLILEHLSQAPWEVEEGGASAVDPAAARRAVVKVHDEAYVERFRRAAERGDGLLDSADNPLAPATWDAAWAAVASALASADWVRGGEGRRAFAAVRPPGHHAERSTAMGFCFFNNAAIVAQWLRDAGGARRVAVVDFDVHHGNGTQHLFEDRGDVLYVSLHQSPFYPGTGARSESGVGEGEGATVNVPLPAGSDDDDYRRAFHDEVLPALDRFSPEALVLSAGFDAAATDPLGGMKVSVGGFREWGAWLRGVADRHCGGAAVSLLEGGYDLRALPSLVEAYLEGLEARA